MATAADDGTLTLPEALKRGILHSRGDALQKQCLYCLLVTDY